MRVDIAKKFFDSKETVANFASQLFFVRSQMSPKVKAKPPAKSPVWNHPNSIERQYYKYIKSIFSNLIDYTNQKIKPMLSRWVYEKELYDSVNFDSWSDEVGNNIEELQNLNKEIFEKDKEQIKSDLTAFAILISQFNNGEFTKITKKITAIDPVLPQPYLDDFIKSWVNENTSLIKGLSDEYVKKISSVINTQIKAGKTSAEVEKGINEIGDQVQGYRSKLIARDQVSKLNGQLTQKRQQDIGIEMYIWRTVGDERVRGSHSKMNGKLCRWDNPNVYSEDEGKTWVNRPFGAVLLHPQEDIQCRCYAEPYFKPLFKEVDDQ